MNGEDISAPRTSINPQLEPQNPHTTKFSTVNMLLTTACRKQSQNGSLASLTKLRGLRTQAESLSKKKKKQQEQQKKQVDGPCNVMP